MKTIFCNARKIYVPENADCQCAGCKETCHAPLGAGLTPECENNRPDLTKIKRTCEYCTHTMDSIMGYTQNQR